MKKPFALFTGIAALAAAAFLVGNLVIDVAWEGERLGWVDAGGAPGIAGVRPGISSLGDVIARRGEPEFWLAASGVGYNVELRYPGSELDNDVVRLRVVGDTPPSRQERLMLDVRASGLFSEEELETGALRFTVLEDRSLLDYVVREVVVEPLESVDHDRVIKAYGRPVLTMSSQTERVGGDVTWVYPKQGLVVIFLEERAIRFTYVDPESMRLGAGAMQSSAL